MNYRLGVIGCGFMATAILKGVIKSGIMQPKEIIVSVKYPESLDKIQKMGITATLENREVAQNSEYIMLGVKPQCFPEVVESCQKGSISKMISIMAGVKSEKIRVAFGEDVKVARCMPNLPCSIGMGMTAVDVSSFTKEEGNFILSLFQGIGEVLSVPEEKLDAVTGISGSGPAYVYLFLKSLILAGMEVGLTEEESKKLAIQTVKGGAEMVQVTDKPIDDLIRAVCSKGGTTIQAMNSFEKDDFKGIVSKAVKACVARSKELSK